MKEYKYWRTTSGIQVVNIQKITVRSIEAFDSSWLDGLTPQEFAP